jgi:hypothetical protein
VNLKKIVQTDAGVFIVEGEFSPEEMEVIIDAGLNTLIKHGALPFIALDAQDTYKVIPPSTLEQ